MRSTRLFQPKMVVNLKPDQKIPTLSDAEKQALFSGETVNFRSGYLYSPERGERHLNAQVIVQALYHMGAILINTGKAYMPEAELCLIEESRIHEITPDVSITAASREKQASLIKIYNNLPLHVSRNGSHCAYNPFQALFVIKVALDHFPPEQTYQLYKSLNDQSSMMTCYPNIITIPNGSQFLDDHSSYQIMASYILHHLDDKFKFIPDAVKARMLHYDKTSGYHLNVIGYKDDPEIKRHFDQVMQAVIPVSIAIKLNQA